MNTKRPPNAEAEVTPPPMYVARGRTVVFDGTQHGPGTMLFVPDEERAHFVRTGFLVAGPPDLTPIQANNPGNVGFQNQNIQGPVYR